MKKLTLFLNSPFLIWLTILAIMRDTLWLARTSTHLLVFYRGEDPFLPFSEIVSRQEECFQIRLLFRITEFRRLHIFRAGTPSQR